MYYMTVTTVLFRELIFGIKHLIPYYLSCIPWAYNPFFPLFIRKYSQVLKRYSTEDRFDPDPDPEPNFDDNIDGDEDMEDENM